MTVRVARTELTHHLSPLSFSFSFFFLSLACRKVETVHLPVRGVVRLWELRTCYKKGECHWITIFFSSHFCWCSCYITRGTKSVEYHTVWDLKVWMNWNFVKPPVKNLVYLSVNLQRVMTEHKPDHKDWISLQFLFCFCLFVF